MKNNRFSRFIFVLVILLILVTFSLNFIASNKGRVIKNSTTISLVSKVDSFISSPFNFLYSLKNDIGDLFSVLEENKSLKKKLSKIEDQAVLISSLENENKSLVDALSISEKYSPNFLVISDTITRSTVSWLDDILINKGEEDGVTINMLAISNGKLVGMVSDLNSSSSSIQLLTNTIYTKSLPVKISTASGFVYGVVSSFDNEKKCVVLSQLNNDNKIEVGDAVLTSGLDGESISEIEVGTVKEVDTDKKVVYVLLDADFNSIDYVTLVGN